MKVLFSLALITTSSIAHGQSFGLSSLFGFAEQNREIVTGLDEVKPLANPNFKLTNQEADTTKALADLDNQIEGYAYSSRDGECDEESQEKSNLREKIEKRKVRLLFSLAYSGQETADNLELLISRDTYAGFLAQKRLAGVTNLPSRNFGTLKNDYEKETGKKLSDLDPSKRSKELELFIKDKYAIDVPGSFLIEEVVREQMIASPKNWHETLASVSNDLSFDEKMRISARIGNTFLEQYNNNRAGTSNGKIVSIEELLTSAQTNTPGGVCRDISFAQSQMLQALGVPKDKIYIVAYSTPRTAHSVIAVQDPNDPSRLVKLNYGEMTEDGNNTGGTALKQVTSLPDTGLNFRIYDADAKPVGKVPSEMGALLRDVTDAPSSFIEYTPYNLNKVTASGELGTFNVFTGTTSSGDSIIGAAFNTTLSETENRKTDLGVSIGKREINSPVVELDQTLIYARLRNEYYTSDITTGPVQSRAHLGVESEVLYSKNEGKHSSNGREIKGNTLDVSTNVFAGVTSSFEAGESKVKAQANVHGYIDWANETEAKNMTLAFDRAEAKVQVETPISPSLMTLAEGGLIIRQYGEAAYLQGAFVDTNSNFRAFASYSTPIGDVPSFMPEADKTVKVGLAYKAGDWNFNASGSKSLTTSDKRLILGAERKF
jgi:hypothetical protein